MKTIIYDVVVKANLPQCGMDGYHQTAYVYEAGKLSDGSLAIHSYEAWPGVPDDALVGEYRVTERLVRAVSPGAAISKFNEWRRSGRSDGWLVDE